MLPLNYPEHPDPVFRLRRLPGERRGMTEWGIRIAAMRTTFLAEVGESEQALAEAAALADRLQAAGDMATHVATLIATVVKTRTGIWIGGSLLALVLLFAIVGLVAGNAAITSSPSRRTSGCLEVATLRSASATRPCAAASSDLATVSR